MIVLLALSFIFVARAEAVERLPRAGVTVPFEQNSWKKMKALSALELSDFDLILENSKNPQNKRMVSTQFSKTSDICRGEFSNLKNAGFNVITASKKNWPCILRAEKGSDLRFIAVRDIKRSAPKKPILLSQVVLVEVGASNFMEFEKWIASVKNINK